MVNDNDSKILKLKEVIENKKKDIDKNKKFNPVTNCILLFRGETYNLNVLNKNKLIELLIELNSLYESASKLDLDEEYLLNGFTLYDWIDDIKQKIEVIDNKNKLKELKSLEDKLNAMLSEDKKTELELNDIENLLK